MRDNEPDLMQSEVEKTEEPPFYRAARLGDIPEMERLLSSVKINAKVDLPHSGLYEVTVFMVAAQSVDGANGDTLAWLRGHGADLHARSANGGTAAWYCAGGGGREQFRPWRQMPDHGERLRFLLDAGLAPDERVVNGQSLLTQACTAGDPARVRLLLEHGVSPNPSKERSTAASKTSPPAHSGFYAFQIPLYCAVLSGSVECVKLLLDAGADLHLRDLDGSSVLAHAGSPEVVRALIAAGANPNAQDVIARVIHDLNYHSDPEDLTVAQALLDGGTSQENAAFHAWTPVYAAAFRHQTEELASLLAEGMSCRITRSGSPLHGICWQGEYSYPEPNIACEQIIRMLIAAGVPIDARDENGDTALHKAAGGDWSNPTAVRLLLEFGAQPELINDAGDTPLHLAACQGSLSSVTALLAAGADPLHRDRQGETSITLAFHHLRHWANIIDGGGLRLSIAVASEADGEYEKKQLQEAEDCLNALIAAATPS